VLVHGMGACHEHFAKLLAELDGNRWGGECPEEGCQRAARSMVATHTHHTCPPLHDIRYTAYGLDLLGFGASDKPLPEAEHTYSYETWSCQVADFVQQVRRRLN
jgi:pimeloyl-ACP methyl ester carboxylesterase